MMSASAPPTLGQSPAVPSSGAAVPPPAAKSASKLPLYIAISAGVLVILLLIIFLALR